MGKEDAQRRDRLALRKKLFFENPPLAVKQRFNDLSCMPRDDVHENPGSGHGDEKDRIFLQSLSEDDRRFVESHVGLGNSQKAEVAWLEKMGFQYVEVCVREWQQHQHSRFGDMARRL